MPDNQQKYWLHLNCWSSGSIWPGSRGFHPRNFINTTIWYPRILAEGPEFLIRYISAENQQPPVMVKMILEIPKASGIPVEVHLLLLDTGFWKLDWNSLCTCICFRFGANLTITSNSYVCVMAVISCKGSPRWPLSQPATYNPFFAGNFQLIK